MREIRTLRLMRRGLETWQGRDTVTLANRKGRATGKTNLDLHRRASPRPYFHCYPHAKFRNESLGSVNESLGSESLKVWGQCKNQPLK